MTLGCDAPWADLRTSRTDNRSHEHDLALRTLIPWHGLWSTTARWRLDSTAICYLLHYTHWPLTVQVRLVDALLQNATGYGLFDAQRQIGFARVVITHAPHRTAWLTDVVIDPSYRSRGIGHWWLSHIVDDLLIATVARVALFTTTQQSFYAGLGFRSEPQIRESAMPQAVVQMSRMIPQAA